MNDDFLSEFRQLPRPEFAETLYAKLVQETKTRLLRRQFVLKRVAFALVALCLAFALTMALSPTLRAAALTVVNDIIKTIIVRGTTVFVENDVPALKGESESYSLIWTPVSPSEVSADYPFFAKLPTWVPSDFVLQERAALFGSITKDWVTSVLFEWKNKRGDTIQLEVLKGSCPNGLLWESGAQRSDCGRMMYISVSPKDQPEVIKINGQPAVLFPRLQMLMDLSDPVREWNPFRGKYDNHDPEAFFLTWDNGEVTFDLAVKSRTVTKENLIRMAESIP